MLCLEEEFEGAFGLAHKTCADPITPSQPKNDERLAGQGADPLVGLFAMTDT
jgi:hypothetical protein